tara:strand:+ start:31 stop:1038 length:1008 start_codon:yes stop_codon:yes gene_type:complete
LVIDIHTHILPKDLPDLEKKFGYGGWIRLDHNSNGTANMIKDGEEFRVVKCNCWDPVARLDDCQESGVSLQVISTIPVMFSYWAQPKHTYLLSRLLNDDIANVVQNNPKRFVGLGTIPMQDEKLAVKELERCIQDLRFPGIQIGSNINGKNLSSQKFFPIFEAAADLGSCIFVHPWNIMGKNQMEKYWLPWLVGMPAETSRAICSMIFSGIFEKLPNLRVAFAHGGGAFPATIGRIQHGYDSRPDLCAIDNNVDPTDYLGKFWIDSLVHDFDMLEFLLKKVGNKKIALGSDYPFPLGEKMPGLLIKNSNLSKTTKENLLYKNALDWLALKSNYFE